MAALNLRTVADRVLALLRSEDVQELGSVYGVLDEKHLQALGKAISSLTPLLLDAERKASDNGIIAEWLIQLEWYRFYAETYGKSIFFLEEPVHEKSRVCLPIRVDNDKELP